MRPKSFILLILALGCGVVASIGITQVMAKRGNDPAQPELEAVVVAVADIPMGDPIARQLVKLEEWPKDRVPKGALKSLEELESRRPKSRIFAGSPVLDNQLLGKGVLEQGASDSIPKGMRVIAVKVDLVSGNASLIRPGDRVDLVAHIQPGGGDLSKTVTRTILQDIKVFAVDNVWEATTGTGEKAIVAKTISLLVTPAQAEKVTLAEEMGKIRLVMRSPDDKEQAKVSGAMAMDVLGGGSGMGMDRMLTSLLPSLPSAKPKASPMTGLLSLLSGGKKSSPTSTEPTAAPPKAKKSNEVFKVRILSESEPRETILELTGDRKSSASDSSFLHWRASGSSPTEPVSEPVEPPSAAPTEPAEPAPSDGPLDKPPEPAPKADKATSLDD